MGDFFLILDFVFFLFLVRYIQFLADFVLVRE